MSPFGYTHEQCLFYIDTDDRLHNDQAASLALTCPHCSVLAHITPLAVPVSPTFRPAGQSRSEWSIAAMPATLPFFCVSTCAATAANASNCHRISARSSGPSEKYTFTYLPQDIEALFRETLLCYSHGLFNSFASMCRRTMQAVFANLGEPGKLRVFDELNDVRDMAEIDASVFIAIKRVLFDTDADAAPSLPLLDDDQAGLLLEVIKDLLYQSYVRKARLQQAMVVRRVYPLNNSANGG